MVSNSAVVRARLTRSPRLGTSFALVIGMFVAAPCAAGQTLEPFDGPPAPEPPAVVSRDIQGRLTLRAERLTGPIRIDGRLDEAVYASVPSISDFIQQEPVEGEAAREKTEVWRRSSRTPSPSWPAMSTPRAGSRTT